MRGKAEKHQQKQSGSGITPAYAGKSGKAPAEPSNGITPAYAGKSFFAYFWGTDAWDHPRLCGEKYCSRSNCDTVIGSPPPMRGKVTNRKLR